MRKVVLILALMGAILSGVAPSVYAQASPAATTTGVVYLRSVKGIFATQSTITADAQAISTTATWNNAGVTFTHWKGTVTDTASASGSKMLEFFAGASGTTSVFAVNKIGSVTSTGSYSLAGSGVYSWGGRSQVQSPSDGVIEITNAAQTDFTRLQFGGTNNTFPSLKRSGTQLQVRLADDSGYGNFTAADFAVKGTLLTSGTAPTISSGFGTSPTVPNNNGTGAFTINVGTGGTATAGVIAMPTATTGWICDVNNLTAAAAHVAYNTRQTATTTTTVTVENQTTSTGAAVAWAASNILNLSCFGY